MSEDEQPSALPFVHVEILGKSGDNRYTTALSYTQGLEMKDVVWILDGILKALTTEILV